jgi:DNA-binding CsgD family transcriptional regulator
LLLLDARGRILRANGAAEALLRRPSGLSARGGRLAAAAASNARRLEALVARAGDADPGARCGGSLSVETDARSRPLSVTVMPVRGRNLEIFNSEPAVLACIADPDVGAAPAASRLRDLFGLTPTEARLALALLNGDTVREAAAAMGIKVNTAGVHLARIFDKTGVNRQSALIKVLLSASPIMRESDEVTGAT